MHEVESDDLPRTWSGHVLSEDIHAAGHKPVLHGDNGVHLKTAPALATLHWLGIAPSYSRPRVSDDNAHVESRPALQPSDSALSTTSCQHRQRSLMRSPRHSRIWRGVRRIRASRGRLRGITAAQHGPKRTDAAQYTSFKSGSYGGPTRIRTVNQRIMSPLL